MVIVTDERKHMGEQILNNKLPLLSEVMQLLHRMHDMG
jgi:hypothetical protein